MGSDEADYNALDIGFEYSDRPFEDHKIVSPSVQRTYARASRRKGSRSSLLDRTNAELPEATAALVSVIATNEKRDHGSSGGRVAPSKRSSSKRRKTRPVVVATDDDDYLQMDVNTSSVARNSTLVSGGSEQERHTNSKRHGGSIIITGIDADRRETIIDIINQFGHYTIADKVTATTRVVVCGNKMRRTYRVLEGIARGCWFVSPQWVYQSLEEMRWVELEAYENVEAYPGAQRSRIVRLNRCGDVINPVFHSKRIHLLSTTTIKLPDLKKLVTICGGVVVRPKDQSVDVFVGDSIPATTMPPPGVAVVTTAWLLDCIVHYEYLPFEQYLVAAP